MSFIFTSFYPSYSSKYNFEEFVEKYRHIGLKSAVTVDVTASQRPTVVAVTVAECQCVELCDIIFWVVKMLF